MAHSVYIYESECSQVMGIFDFDCPSAIAHNTNFRARIAYSATHGQCAYWGVTTVCIAGMHDFLARPRQ